MSRKKIRSHWCCAHCGDEHLRDNSIAVPWVGDRSPLQFCSRVCIDAMAVEAALLSDGSRLTRMTVHPRVYKPRDPRLSVTSPAWHRTSWRHDRKMLAGIVARALRAVRTSR